LFGKAKYKKAVTWMELEFTSKKKNLRPCLKNENHQEWMLAAVGAIQYKVADARTRRGAQPSSAHAHTNRIVRQRCRGSQYFSLLFRFLWCARARVPAAARVLFDPFWLGSEPASVDQAMICVTIAAAPARTRRHGCLNSKPPPKLFCLFGAHPSVSCGRNGAWRWAGPEMILSVSALCSMDCGV